MDNPEVYNAGIERETQINYNEKETCAFVFTCNRGLQNKLQKLAEERPGECLVVEEYPESKAIEFRVPKRWVKITPPRKVILTEEQRAARAEHLRAYRAKQKREKA